MFGVGCLWGSFSMGGLGRGWIGGPIGSVPIRLRVFCGFG